MSSVARIPSGEPKAPEAAAPRPRRDAAMARRAVMLAALATVVAAVVRAVPSLGAVRHRLASMNPWWAAAAGVFELASCMSFVPVFDVFFDAVPVWLARRIAWIEMGSGALLPGGGVTSFAMGGLFLHRAGMRTRLIVVRSGGVFWLTTGVNAFAAIIAALLLLFGVVAGPSNFVHAGLPLLIVVPLTVAVAAAPWLFGSVRRTQAPSTWSSSLIDGVGDAWRAARNPSWCLLGAFGYLGFDIAVLFCLVHGLGAHVSWPVLILAYLAGYVATMVPIPAGVGVLEGGIAAALVLYGLPVAPSVAAVLVYHAIAFWIPSLGGLCAWADLTFSGQHLQSARRVRLPRA